MHNERLLKQTQERAAPHHTEHYPISIQNKDTDYQN